MEYDTKEKAEKIIKKMNCLGAFSPVFENQAWYIMSNVTGKIIK